MPIIQGGQVALNVAEAGTGQPMLLVHGFPLNHSMWAGQMEGLASDCRVIAPDLRGFGQSPFVPGSAADGAVTMEDYADDLAALLDARDVRVPVVLCGLSMGGYIAWQFWRRHAARLAALILCDTKSSADTAEAAGARRQMAERVLKEGAAVAAEAMLPKFFARSTVERQPALVESMRQAILATLPEAIAAAQRGMAQRADVTGWLKAIDVPALVLAGAEDVISPPAEMRAMAAAMPQARFVEVPEAGHMAPLEQPNAVNQAVREFLGSL
jgi:3-oxoadipate enol-lactonase